MEPLPRPGEIAPPIVNEVAPKKPIKWELPVGGIRYKVQDGDTWESVAAKFQVKSAMYLMFFNFYVVVNPRNKRATDEVNWYLRNYVGCNVSKDGNKNWAFSSSAKPGVIFIPVRTLSFEGDGLVVLGSTGVGDVIGVPEYDDSTFIDAIGKALDIYGAADLGLSVSGVALPWLVEGGMIGAGAATAVVGPLVAIGGPHAEALQKRNRDHFFGGFAPALVMAANGASREYIKDHNDLNFPPLDSVYPEKTETFRKIHNAGVELGIRKGKLFNTVDQKRFFTFLHGQLSARDQEYFGPKDPWREWSAARKKAYYDTLASIVKQTMLKNGLKFRFHD